jgi:hypothetical protein
MAFFSLQTHAAMKTIYQLMVLKKPVLAQFHLLSKAKEMKFSANTYQHL